jgi:RNA polymerase sigma-70 factor (ECF subfamily)
VHRALVDRAKGGDREAFDALARAVGDRCMSLAHRILRDADQAEDAVQAALIMAWRQLRSLRDPDAFEPWLHRILTHECYAEARRDHRMRAEIRVLPAYGQAESADILAVNDRDELERAFRRLTLEQRAVRLPSLPRPVRGRGWRTTRHSSRDGQVPTVPCNGGAAGQPRS